YLYHARNFYTQAAPNCSEEQRKLALEELFIAEGSDWNWWYGPEHHSANDRDFDELYRKHLSNVYQALGATPPDYLAQPIMGGVARPLFQRQTSYIRPRITGDMVRYFEWMGAAHYTADRRSGAMHGKVFLLDSIYAGIDEKNVYGRMDFAGGVPDGDFEIVVNLESWCDDHAAPRRALRLDARLHAGKLAGYSLADNGNALPQDEVLAVLAKNFEFKLPLALLAVEPPESWQSSPTAGKIRVRFSVWQNRLPADALPVEGWLELQLVSEEDLVELAI
ncbi:MAG TPA: hypothetical protein VFB00_01270, partial [Terriglobales bacterium]|nr:hypothetical protein [Terriglobales bacterium]